MLKTRFSATRESEQTMKISTKHVAPILAAFAIGGALAIAPIASAATQTAPTAVATAPAVAGGTDPLVPYGTEPQVPYRLGYINSNHDEANTSAGQLDLPF
jgi:hypothetical protein